MPFTSPSLHQNQRKCLYISFFVCLIKARQKCEFYLEKCLTHFFYSAQKDLFLLEYFVQVIFSAKIAWLEKKIKKVEKKETYLEAVFAYNFNSI